MKTLKSFERLNDIRQRKNELFKSLSIVEVEILDAVAFGGSCFGSRPGTGNGRAVLTIRKNEDKIVTQSIVDTLVLAGWLRFAETPAVRGCGNFWMTHSAERVWRELGRRVA